MEEWKCLTIADFVTTGLRATAPYYVAGAGALFALRYLGLLSWGTYWRWLAFAGLALLEIRLLTRVDAALLPAFLPAPPAALAALLPRAYLPFQLLKVAHKVVISLFVALSRIGPLLEAMSSPRATPGGGTAEQQTARSVERLEQLIAGGGLETGRQLAFEAIPFSGLGAPPGQEEAARSSTLGMLQRELRDCIMANSLRADPEVQSAIRRVVERGRAGPGS